VRGCVTGTTVVVGAVTVACALVVLLCCFLSAGPLDFETTSLSVTDLQQGDVVEREFRFQNRGKEVIKLVQLRTSSPCLRAQIDPKSIAPGEWGRIQVRLDTKGVTGRHRYTVFLRTDAIDQEVVELSLRAGILPQR